MSELQQLRRRLIGIGDDVVRAIDKIRENPDSSDFMTGRANGMGSVLDALLAALEETAGIGTIPGEAVNKKKEQ